MIISKININKTPLFSRVHRILYYRGGFLFGIFSKRRHTSQFQTKCCIDDVLLMENGLPITARLQK